MHPRSPRAEEHGRHPPRDARDPSLHGPRRGSMLPGPAQHGGREKRTRSRGRLRPHLDVFRDELALKEQARLGRDDGLARHLPAQSADERRHRLPPLHAVDGSLLFVGMCVFLSAKSAASENASWGCGEGKPER